MSANVTSDQNYALSFAAGWYLDGKALEGAKRPVSPVNGHPRTGEQELVVKTTIPPHSFRAFKID